MQAGSKLRIEGLSKTYRGTGGGENVTALKDVGIEIGAGLGALAGKIWRIGLMGYSSRVENVIACLNALEAVLTNQGRDCEPGAAVAAAYRSYAQQSLVAHPPATAVCQPG